MAIKKTLLEKAADLMFEAAILDGVAKKKRKIAAQRGQSPHAAEVTEEIARKKRSQARQFQKRYATSQKKKEEKK